MVLLRHLLGDVLRRLRVRQGRTLREVSGVARVSLGYLSEVERGQKEASSELLAAICTALGVSLSHVLREVSDGLALIELQSGHVFEVPKEPALGQRADRELVPAPAGTDGPVGTARHPVLESRVLGGKQVFRDEPRELDDLTDMIPV
jgi:transcriptional regulator with XRE-family HTH domain